MNVPSNSPSVRHRLRDAAEQLEGERFLFDVHAVHRRSDRSRDHPENVRARARLTDELSIFLRHFDFLELDVFLLDRVDVHEDVEEGRLRARTSLLDATQDPVHHDALTGSDASGEVVLDIQCETLRLLPAAQTLRRFLDLELLR